MKQFQDLMRKAQAAQSQMQEFQGQVETFEETGTSGGGLVRCTLSGKGIVKAVHIDPSLLKPEEKELLEDLVAAAFTDARKRMTARVNEEMSKITGGLVPPGMQLPGMF